MATRRADMMEFKSAFPLITIYNHKVTGNPDDAYNCIAWAIAGATHSWWWPGRIGWYWPKTLPQNLSISTFSKMLTLYGFHPTNNEGFVAGTIRIALFANDFGATHMARQLSDAWWTSKAGRHEVFRHPLRVVEGPEYGHVVSIWEKSARTDVVYRKNPKQSRKLRISR